MYKGFDCCGTLSQKPQHKNMTYNNELVTHICINCVIGQKQKVI